MVDDGAGDCKPGSSDRDSATTTSVESAVSAATDAALSIGASASGAGSCDSSGAAAAGTRLLRPRPRCPRPPRRRRRRVLPVAVLSAGASSDGPASLAAESAADVNSALLESVGIDCSNASDGSKLMVNPQHYACCIVCGRNPKNTVSPSIGERRATDKSP